MGGEEGQETPRLLGATCSILVYRSPRPRTSPPHPPCWAPGAFCVLSRCFARAVFTGSQAKLFSFPFLVPRTPKQLSNWLHAAKNTFPLQTTVSSAAVLRPDPLLGAPPPASCQRCPQENARETEAEDAFFYQVLQPLETQQGPL